MHVPPALPIVACFRDCKRQGLEQLIRCVVGIIVSAGGFLLLLGPGEPVAHRVVGVVECVDNAAAGLGLDGHQSACRIVAMAGGHPVGIGEPGAVAQGIVTKGEITQKRGEAAQSVVCVVGVADRGVVRHGHFGPVAQTVVLVVDAPVVGVGDPGETAQGVVGQAVGDILVARIAEPAPGVVLEGGDRAVGAGLLQQPAASYCRLVWLPNWSVSRITRPRES